jgi:hypothetical protein
VQLHHQDRISAFQCVFELRVFLGKGSSKTRGKKLSAFPKIHRGHMLSGDFVSFDFFSFDFLIALVKRPSLGK